MDSNGEFKGPWMIAPRKYPYQMSGTAIIILLKTGFSGLPQNTKRFIPQILINST